MQISRHFPIARQVIPYLVLSLILLPGILNAASDPGIDEIVSEMEKKYAHKSFSADFHQVSTLAALDMSDPAQGKVYFSHPGKMRWEYLQADPHQIITNGKTVWIYQPEINQVMVSDAESFFKEGGGGAFLSDITRVRKFYDIEKGTHTDRYFELVLKAKNKQTDIDIIRILLTRTTHLIEKVTTKNPYGDTTEFEFSNIQFGQISMDRFEFQPPDGVDIMRMNEQF